MRPIQNQLAAFLSIGTLQFKGIQPKPNTDLHGYIEAQLPDLVNRFLSKLPDGYSDSRKLYRASKVDPTRYRPSSEALWRRVKKGEPLPKINPFVDTINFLSLSHQYSYGLYNTDRLDGDIIADIGTSGDGYDGIRKDRINLEGKICLKDDFGPFGNPSADSLRASTSEETRHILAVIFFFSESAERERVVKNSFDIFSRFFNFESGIAMLDNRQIDL